MIPIISERGTIRDLFKNNNYEKYSGGKMKDLRGAVYKTRRFNSCIMIISLYHKEQSVLHGVGSGYTCMFVSDKGNLIKDSYDTDMSGNINTVFIDVGDLASHYAEQLLPPDKSRLVVFKKAIQKYVIGQQEKIKIIQNKIQEHESIMSEI